MTPTTIAVTRIEFVSQPRKESFKKTGDSAESSALAMREMGKAILWKSRHLEKGIWIKPKYRVSGKCFLVACEIFHKLHLSLARVWSFVFFRFDEVTGSS
jgi:hypothetical protein